MLLLLCLWTAAALPPHKTASQLTSLWWWQLQLEAVLMVRLLVAVLTVRVLVAVLTVRLLLAVLVPQHLTGVRLLTSLVAFWHVCWKAQTAPECLLHGVSSICEHVVGTAYGGCIWPVQTAFNKVND
jgi:hypothetical protein